MRKFLTSLLTIAAVVAVGFLATNAFFSDTETSTGNLFQAGAIDLLIDSEAHYAGLVCRDTSTGEELANYVWVQVANTTTRPDLVGDGCNLSWESTNLTDHKFFDYDDLKPGDTGENTISLTVENNPAWVCAEITVTADSDMDCTDPEIDAETALGGTCVAEDINGTNGEMTENLSFAWWADDGDNILQPNEVESLFFQSGVSLQDILTAAGGGNTLYLTLADSLQNFFGTDGQPLVYSATPYYVGLAWCFGEMDIDLGTGVITCDGEPVGNEAQTDLMTANISFSAVQERNNPNFRCQDSFRPETTPTPTPEIIVETSSLMNFSSTGWAGWSCPNTHPNIVSGDTNCTQPLTNSLAWEQGAFVGAFTYPTTPFGYSYGTGEEGWIVQNGGTGQSCNIILQCQAN